MTASYLRIDSGYFCAGVVLDDAGRVVRFAPILHYMRGWSEARVRAYAQHKGWVLDAGPVAA